MPSATAVHALDLDKYLKSFKGQSLDASIESLISHLKRRQIKGAESCAIATAHILLQVVAKSKWQDVDTLLLNICRTGRKLVEAQPRELVIANIVRRVLGLIRDEAEEDRNELSSETPSEVHQTPTKGDVLSYNSPSTPQIKPDSVGDYGFGSVRPAMRPTPSLSTANSFTNPKSLFHILSASPPTDSGLDLQGSPFGTSGASTPMRRSIYGQTSALRSEVIDGIEEIKDEISQVDDLIAAVADVQIHPGDYVLVHQPSPTVERFILRAAAKRKFTILLALEAPRKDVQNKHTSFIKKLSSAGIAVITLMNGGLMAYMSRVNKVILGARAVVANGGVVADSGAAAIARAAKEQGNAVVVLSGIYKLSPENPFDEASLVEWGDSAGYVSFGDGPVVSGVEIRSALTEVIPAECVDTYITNLGTHSRDHLSSLLADHYKQEDIDFHLWDNSER